MALVVFLQEDEDVPSVYRNLKIFCETAPRPQFLETYKVHNHGYMLKFKISL